MKTRVVAGLLLGIMIGCHGGADRSYVAFKLIAENHARCFSLANDVANVWADSLGTGTHDLSIAVHYLGDGAPDMAAIGEAEEIIDRLMKEMRDAEGLGVSPELLEAYSLSNSTCGLAHDPVGRSLLVFNARKSELQDEFTAVAAKLRVLLDSPSEETLEALAAHQALIQQAEQAVVDERARREEERKEKERIRQEVVREALERRRAAEAELQAEHEKAVAQAEEERRREQEQADQEREAARQARRAEERREQEASARRAARKAQQVHQEMIRWHPLYREAMEPLRQAVGQVTEAWSRTTDPLPACRRLRAELEHIDRDELLSSPDPALNERLKSMLDGLGSAAALCQAGSRFRAESTLKSAIQHWGQAGEIIKSHSLQP